MEATVPDALSRVEHIVVLQLENRSFDHVLGYLALAGNELPDHGEGLESTVDGLDGSTNHYQGRDYPATPLDQNVFDVHRLDPPHDAPEVERQIAGGAMTGFVEAWAEKLYKKSSHIPLKRWLHREWERLRHRPYPDPGDLAAVMGYATPEMVPVYDHLVRHYCVCDRWFCSVAGPTMPNRFASVTGEHGGSMSNLHLLIADHGKFHSFFRDLANQAMWRWYSSDPGILRAIDDTYRFDTDPAYDHFAYLTRYTEVQPRTFLSDLHDGTLPPVAWIDPNFAIAHFAGATELESRPTSDDDHPPSRLIRAQKLVNLLHEALGRSEYWDKTMFVIFYDEHGGFHDHVKPFAPGRGPRIPALVLGGRVRRGVCSTDFHHASLIKTILLRFGREGALKDGLSDEGREAVQRANDLSLLLRDDDEPVPFAPLPADRAGEAAVTDSDLVPQPLPPGASTLSRAIDFLDKELTDLQELIVKHHAVPLRSGREKLSRVPTKPLKEAVLARARKDSDDERLEDRRP
jgi:phospholipase C